MSTHDYASVPYRSDIAAEINSFKERHNLLGFYFRSAADRFERRDKSVVAYLINMRDRFVGHEQERNVLRNKINRKQSIAIQGDTRPFFELYIPHDTRYFVALILFKMMSE